MAQIIHAMGSRGMAPGTYEDAELWEVAAALGANRVDDDSAPGPVTAGFDQFQAPA